jgi:hypothetical protein
MLDLINREAAVRAVEDEQNKQRLLAIDLEAESPTLAQTCLVKALGMQFAIAALRTLPSVDPCKNCMAAYVRDHPEEEDMR